MDEHLDATAELKHMPSFSSHLPCLPVWLFALDLVDLQQELRRVSEKQVGTWVRRLQATFCAASCMKVVKLKIVRRRSIRVVIRHLNTFLGSSASISRRFTRSRASKALACCANQVNHVYDMTS